MIHPHWWVNTIIYQRFVPTMPKRYKKSPQLKNTPSKIIKLTDSSNSDEAPKTERKIWCARALYKAELELNAAKASGASLRKFQMQRKPLDTIKRLEALPVFDFIPASKPELYSVNEKYFFGEDLTKYLLNDEFGDRLKTFLKEYETKIKLNLYEEAYKILDADIYNILSIQKVFPCEQMLETGTKNLQESIAVKKSILNESNLLDYASRQHLPIDVVYKLRKLLSFKKDVLKSNTTMSNGKIVHINLENIINDTNDRTT